MWSGVIVGQTGGGGKLALENSKLQIINQKNWIYAVTQIGSFTMGFIRAQQDTNYC
jgi:hypothetical protein